MYVYSIYDKKANYYATPFYLPTDVHATREFTRIVHDPNSNLNKFPEDYSIVCLGEFDDTAGVFLLLTEFRLVADGGIVKKDVVQLEKDVVSDYIKSLKEIYANDLDKIQKSLTDIKSTGVDVLRKRRWFDFIGDK